MENLVKGIRKIERAMGDGKKKLMPSEKNTLEVARKSVCASRNIKAGEIITAKSIVIKRPGTGVPPSMLDLIIGRKAMVDIPKETLISLCDLS